MFSKPNEPEKNGIFLEFSLCLSRACLGKMFVFIYKWLKNAVFRTGLAAAVLSARVRVDGQLHALGVEVRREGLHAAGPVREVLLELVRHWVAPLPARAHSREQSVASGHHAALDHGVGDSLVLLAPAAHRLAVRGERVPRVPAHHWRPLRGWHRWRRCCVGGGGSLGARQRGGDKQRQHTWDHRQLVQAEALSLVRVALRRCRAAGCRS
jgi:hypothetical protein